jgi:hypothetical protein
MQRSRELVAEEVSRIRIGGLGRVGDVGGIDGREVGADRGGHGGGVHRLRGLRSGFGRYAVLVHSGYPRLGSE